MGEAIEVLDQYLARGLISEKGLDTALRSLISESMKMAKLGALRMLSMTSKSLIESWMLVLRHHVYETDALQIASSKEAGCNLFLAADQRLVQVARKEGIYALDVEKEPEKAREQIIKG